MKVEADGAGPMPKVNPDILIWARETAGLSPEDAVAKLGINDAWGVVAVDRLHAIESGEVEPSRPTLVKMAKQYRRPLLTFYLREPPRTADRGHDYRLLPDTLGEDEIAWVDVIVRDIYARQSLVREVLIDDEETQEISFIGAFRRADGVAEVVRGIEDFLDFDQEAYRGFNKIDDAFAYLRGQAEAAGVFVLLVDNLGSWHTTIPVEAFRGFALADKIAPFIAINANDSRGAWCFTLIHELAHLALGDTAISAERGDQATERFCNDAASEFLVPAAEVTSLGVTGRTPLEDTKAQISAFARERNVSNTMVAYKLYRAGAFSYERFDTLRLEFKQEFLDYRARERKKNREKEGGPTYQTLRKHRAGTTLIRLVDRMIYSGNLTTTKAGKVLGVSPKNVQGLLETVRPGI